MRCEQVESMLPLFIEGELQSTLKKNVETHLASCELCKEELLLIRLSEKALSEEPTPVPLLPMDFEARVLKGIEMAEERDPVRYFGRLLLASAVGLLVFVVASILHIGFTQGGVAHFLELALALKSAEAFASLAKLLIPFVFYSLLAGSSTLGLLFYLKRKSFSS